MINFNEIERLLEEIRFKNNRLLELCMYALIRDTDIYNHELDDVTKMLFMTAIANNLTLNTSDLRAYLIDMWKKREQLTGSDIK